MKKTSVQVLITIIITLIGQFGIYKDLRAQDSQWSKESKNISYFHIGIRRIEIMSPDKIKNIIVDSSKLDLLINEKPLPRMSDIYVETLAELLWSPNSKAFVLSQSDGGWVGRWYVVVYKIKNGHVLKLNIGKSIIKSFKKYYSCAEVEEPNIAAIKWLRGGKELLMVAEVPPHSSCPEMGKIRGYIVDLLSEKITKEIDEKKFRKKWNCYLGVRFIKN